MKYPRILSHLLLLNGLLSLYLTGEISLFIFLLPLFAYILRFFPGYEKVENFIEEKFGYITFILIGIFLSVLYFKITTVLHAVANFIILTSIFRILGPQSPRQLYQVILISLFEMLSSVTLTGEIYISLFLLLHIFLSPWALLFVFASSKEGGEEIIYASRKFLFFSFMMLLLVGSLLFTSLIFILFPRVTFSIFKPLVLEKKFISAFSDTVEIGETGRILERAPVVMRLVPEGSVKKGDYFYLRGLAFDLYEGGRWTNSKPSTRLLKGEGGKFSLPFFQGKEKDLSFIVYFEEFFSDKIFYTYSTVQVEINTPHIYYEGNGVLKFPENRFPLKYKLKMGNDFFLKEEGEEKAYLQIPPQVRDDLVDFIERNFGSFFSVEDITEFFRKNYRYSLEAKRSDFAIDPVIDFLKNTKEGNCELFASATALLLRAKGVPSRLVGGFLVHEWNDVGEYFLVRERNAHTWVEYFDGYYWKPVDTTPYTEIIKFKGSSSIFRDLADAVKLLWIEYILEYSLEKQMKAVERLKKERWENLYPLYRRVRKSMKNLIPFLIPLFLLLIFFYKYLRDFSLSGFSRGKNEDYIYSFYKKLLREIERKTSMVKKESETPLQFVGRVKNFFPPDIYEELMVITWKFYEYYYGGRVWKNSLKSLERVKGKIENLKRR